MKYRKALTFSYDDGIEQDRKLVEIFNRYGMKATFNLNTGIQSPESNFEIEGVQPVTVWVEIRSCVLLS